MPFPAAHTCIANIMEYPPGAGSQIKVYKKCLNVPTAWPRRLRTPLASPSANSWGPSTIPWNTEDKSKIYNSITLTTDANKRVGQKSCKQASYLVRFIKEIFNSLSKLWDKSVRVTQHVQTKYNHVHLADALECNLTTVTALNTIREENAMARKKCKKQSNLNLGNIMFIYFIYSDSLIPLYKTKYKINVYCEARLWQACGPSR